MNWPEEFAPQAIRDVEEAVDWLADNGGPHVARRMALATVEAARRTVEERFTCERMVQGTIEVYRQVLS